MDFLMRKAGFEKSEAEFFLKLYTLLSSEDKQLLENLRNRYMNENVQGDVDEIMAELSALADKYGYNNKSFYMLLLTYSLPFLKEKYDRAGYGEDMYFEISKDLKYKLDECKTVHGVLGVMLLYWHKNIFSLKIFSLGRFQYHEDPFFADSYTYGDFTVKGGDSVCRFHIPSSGPMTREMRMDSYKRAFEFFGKKKGEYLVITCNSWLLDPQLENVYPKDSNLYDFLQDFDLIERVEPTQVFSNCWRVFGVDYKGSTQNLRSDTSLQKNFIKWLDEGNSVGGGKGVIIFDGEKIVNKQK